MAELELKTNAPGLDKVIGQMGKLSKAEQRAALNAVGLGKKLDNSTKKASKGLVALKKHTLDVGKGFLSMAGASGGAQIVSGIISQMKKNMQEFIALQKEAAQGNRSIVGALGGVIDNRPNISVGELSRLKTQSGQNSRPLGAGGQAKYIKAYQDLSPTDSTEEQKHAAISKAVQAKTINSEVDLSAFAKGLINISNDLKRSKDPKVQELIKGKDIENISVGLMKAVGLQFTGDAANALKQVTTLQSNSMLGAGFAESAALFGMASQANDDTEGKTSGKLVGNVLGKFAGAEGKSIKGKKINFESDNPLERLIEFTKRLKAGDFGTSASDKANAVKTVAGEGAEARAFLLTLAKDGSIEKFTNNIKSFKEAFKGTDIIAQDFNKLSKVSNIKEISETDRIKGVAEQAVSGNSKLASFEEAQERINAVNKGFGLQSRFFETEVQELKRNFSSPEEFYNSELNTSFKRAGFAQDKAQFNGTGFDITQSEFGQTLKSSGGNLKQAAAGAIGKVNAADGVSPAEKTLLGLAGVSQELIKKLETDSSVMVEIKELLGQANEQRKEANTDRQKGNVKKTSFTDYFFGPGDDDL